MSATIEMAVLALTLATAGLVYFRWSGKRFDKRFPPRR